MTSLLAGGAGPAAAAQKLRVLLDWFANPSHAPIIVAKQKGFFAAEGLDVDVIVPSSADDATKLLIARQADVGINYEPQLIMQQAEGVPLVRIGTIIDRPLTCLMVKSDGPALDDLKGKKIGYSIGDLQTILMRTILARHGLKLGDVELVNVNFSLASALASGQVDAVIGAYRNFEPIQLAMQGVSTHCYPVEEEGVPSYDEMVYVANRGDVGRPELKAFMDAVTKAAAWLKANPDAAFDSFKTFAPELDDELNRRSWTVTVPAVASPPGALDKAGYEKVAAYLQAGGLIKEVLPPERYGVDLTVP
ncbi:ABC transporter substrate-binding protein [Arboricoccus pini]|nr:ABC transporter substrate-binding protein [Arboricoccus pini]